MAISNKQRIAMACIVLVGVLGGVAVWTTGRATADGTTAEHAEHAEAGHSETDGAADAHRPGEDHGGRLIALSDEQRTASGIEVRTAGPARLQATVRFQGEIHFNDDRTAHVVPRLAGIAEAVPASLGQQVRKGEVLAVIASTSLSEQRSELLIAQKRRGLAKATYNREKRLWEDGISARQDYQQAESALQEADIAVENAEQKLAAIGAGSDSSRLNRFEIRAPFAGTVVEKHLSLGEAVKDDASIFTVSDLSTVWAEFAVAPKDLASVRVGQRVVVSSTAFDGRADGTIAYLGALLGEQTRTARARVTLPNPDGAWRPGLFVTVTVAVLGEERNVPLAVSADAVQDIDGQATLFLASPGGYLATAVKLGRSDGSTVEILDGVRPGDRYAATNTFILKSDLGKASAEHGH